MTADIIVELLTGITLLALSVQDAMEQKIHIAIPAIAGGMIAVIQLCTENMTVQNMAAGASVGGMLIFISFLCHGNIGMGDGIVLLMTGIASGFWGNLTLLWISSAMAGIYGIYMVVIKHKKRDYRMAFVPFVFGGYVCCVTLELISMML